MSLLHLVAFLIVFVLGAVVGGFVFRNNPKYLAKIETELRAKWEAELKDHPALSQYKSELSAMMVLYAAKIEEMPSLVAAAITDLVKSEIVKAIEDKLGKK
jgi:hypothetical protein